MKKAVIRKIVLAGMLVCLALLAAGCSGKNDLQRIEVEGARLEYLAGEQFDASNLEVTAYFRDESSRVVSEYKISETGPLTALDSKITVSYKKGWTTKSVTLDITVKEVKEESKEREAKTLRLGESTEIDTDNYEYWLTLDEASFFKVTCGGSARSVEFYDSDGTWRGYARGGYWYGDEYWGPNYYLQSGLYRMSVSNRDGEGGTVSIGEAMSVPKVEQDISFTSEKGANYHFYSFTPASSGLYNIGRINNDEAFGLCIFESSWFDDSYKNKEISKHAYFDDGTEYIIGVRSESFALEILISEITTQEIAGQAVTMKENVYYSFTLAEHGVYRFEAKTGDIKSIELRDQEKPIRSSVFEQNVISYVLEARTYFLRLFYIDDEASDTEVSISYQKMSIERLAAENNQQILYDVYYFDYSPLENGMHCFYLESGYTMFFEVYKNGAKLETNSKFNICYFVELCKDQTYILMIRAYGDPDGSDATMLRYGRDVLPSLQAGKPFPIISKYLTVYKFTPAESAFYSVTGGSDKYIPDYRILDENGNEAGVLRTTVVFLEVRVNYIILIYDQFDLNLNGLPGDSIKIKVSNPQKVSLAKPNVSYNNCVTHDEDTSSKSFLFTPDEAGAYTFYSKGFSRIANDSVSVQVKDLSGKLLGSNRNAGADNFSLTVDMKAHHTYVIYVSYFKYERNDTKIPGSFNISKA